MTNSKFDYVKSFETNDALLPEMYLVVRVDGHGFTKFCDKYSFLKPNDDRAIDLMNACAVAVMEEFNDIILAYGQSDEYSFLFQRDAKCFLRRSSKITSLVAACFSSNYVLKWSHFFEMPLDKAPFFDGRVVAYPRPEVVRDYFSWRQVDCHINNMYNTTFWALVKKGVDQQSAEKFTNRIFTVPSEKQTSEQKENKKHLQHETLVSILSLLSFPKEEIEKVFPSIIVKDIASPSTSTFSEITARIASLSNISTNSTSPAKEESQHQTLGVREYLTHPSPVFFKNETLFRLGINYNFLSEKHKKGTVVIRRSSEWEKIQQKHKLNVHDCTESAKCEQKLQEELSDDSLNKSNFVKDFPFDGKEHLELLHVDIIKDDFWNAHPYILGFFDHGLFDPFHPVEKAVERESVWKKGKMKREEKEKQLEKQNSKQ